MENYRDDNAAMRILGKDSRKYLGGLTFFFLGLVAATVSTGASRIMLSRSDSGGEEPSDYGGIIMMERQSAMAAAKREGSSQYTFTVPGNVILGVVPNVEIK